MQPIRMTPTQDTLRAAVIGVGAMGANHARVYVEMPGVDLAGLADVDGARVQAFSRERDARGPAGLG